MSNRIITISREFGSGGRTIGNKLAEKLGISCYDAELLEKIGDALHDTVPCTACRYCTDGCPMGLDIPMLIAGYNDAKFQSAFTVPMLLEALPEDKLPTSCIGCRACENICPQKIEISKIMADFSAIMPTMMSWKKICLERAAQAKQNDKRK